MRLRVVTYNVRSFRAGVDAAVEALGEAPPDLVLVQEHGSPRALEQFAGRLGLEAVRFRRRRSRIRNAVLHDPGWRVVEATSQALPRQGRTMPRGLLSVRLRRGPVHLRAMSAHFGLAAAERLRHAEILADGLMGAGEPVVLGTDLNEMPESGAARWLGERLYDAHAAAGDGGGLSFPAAAPTARIDYLFVSEGVRVLGCSVGDAPAAARASDHRPVLAELELPDGPGAR